ncbi:hypothetical protein SDC9_101006 [bioreactor metagenome]|uniref:Uncharacterized protein n=1 Tax=bioreactor metagenome TaxID=1076179 RepID=A0A645ALW3_9ZZZZ
MTPRAKPSSPPAKPGSKSAAGWSRTASLKSNSASSIPIPPGSARCASAFRFPMPKRNCCCRERRCRTPPPSRPPVIPAKANSSGWATRKKDSRSPSTPTSFSAKTSGNRLPSRRVARRQRWYSGLLTRPASSTKTLCSVFSSSRRRPNRARNARSAT